MIAAYLAIGVLAVAGALVYLQLRGISRYQRQRVVVHTRDQRSIRGVLEGVYRDCVVVSHAQYLAEAQPTELKGEAVVPKANLAWIQAEGDK